MSMTKFHRIAKRMDEHMRLLESEGIRNPHEIINRMMGYIPDLHEIWTGTSDHQLMALSQEFPGFYRYASIMEEASAAEQNKPSRPYDGIAQFSKEHQQQASQLLTTATTLEQGYQVLRKVDTPTIFQNQAIELHRLHQQWLSDLSRFKNALREQNTDPRALGYVDKTFEQISERIKQLA